MATERQDTMVTEEQYLKEGESYTNAWTICPKSKFHHNFKPVTEFILENERTHLYNDDEIFKCITHMIQLTGMFVITLNDKSRFGTGFIQRIRAEWGQCPCLSCVEDGKPKRFYILTISTVNHVIVSSSDMPKTKFLLDYEKEGQSIDDCEALRGIRLLDSDRDVSDEADWCAVEFVSHNEETIKRLQEALDDYETACENLYQKYKDDKTCDLAVVVGHPHGGPKHVSIGHRKEKVILREVRERQVWCRYDYDTLTCPGNSGSPVLIPGQPLCGYGYWFGHPHNHSKGNRDTLGSSSSIGVDHVDSQLGGKK